MWKTFEPHGKVKTVNDGDASILQDFTSQSENLLTLSISLDSHVTMDIFNKQKNEENNRNPNIKMKCNTRHF